MKVPASSAPTISKPASNAPPTSALSAVLAKRASAATTPVSIAEVEKRFGWKTGGWQDRLLTSADAANNRDQKVTKAEIEKYLKNPADAKFVTSDMLQSLSQATSSAPKAIRGLKGAEATFAKAADSNKDGRLSSDEFMSYSATVKGAPSDAPTKWIADQQATMFGSSVASLTKEGDALLPKGFNGPVLDRSYMRIVENENTLTPNVVSYTLTAADIAQGGQVKRNDRFHADPQWKPSPTKEDYSNTGFDRGHLKPADDSPNAEAMDESFLMTNMAPQHGELNQATWRYLEAGINQLVQATGGKATIHTGNLFLDDKGNALPDDKIHRAGSGSTKIGVPTHNFKSVLLETPDGKKQLFSFIVPNRSDLARDLPWAQKVLLAARVSTETLEKKLGNVNLFPTLSAAESKGLKSNAAPVVKFENANQFSFAKLLWPQSSS